MIKVNLLPQELSGKAVAASGGGEGEGGAVVALVALVVLAIVGTGGWWVYNEIDTAEKNREKLEKESAQLESELKKMRSEWEEIETALRVLENQWAIIQSLDPPERLLWTQKINMLPLLVPKNVFITDLILREQVDEVETEEYKAAYRDWAAKGSKGTPPIKSTQPVIKQTFALSGIAFSPENSSEQRLGAIIEFDKNINEKMVKIPFSGKEEEFLNGFVRRIAYSAIEQDRVGDREVSKFTFTLSATPTVVNKNAKMPGTENLVNKAAASSTSGSASSAARN